MAEILIVDSIDLDTATRTVWGEARGEPVEGWGAVAWVLRNRLEWPGGPFWWSRHPAGGVRPNSIAAVCRQPFQFSCWNSNDPNCPKLKALSIADPTYLRIHEIVEQVMNGEINDPTGHASHYEMVGTGAAWGRNRAVSKLIGHHAFYSIGPSA